MIETIANTTAGITKSRKKPPTPIVMQPVINSSPRKAGSAGVEHRRSDNESRAANSTVPASAAFPALSGRYHRATSSSIPQKQALPSKTIASPQ